MLFWHLNFRYQYKHIDVTISIEHLLVLFGYCDCGNFSQHFRTNTQKSLSVLNWIFLPKMVANTFSSPLLQYQLRHYGICFLPSSSLESGWTLGCFDQQNTMEVIKCFLLVCCFCSFPFGSELPWKKSLIWDK